MPSLISKNRLNFRTPEEFVEALEAVGCDNCYLAGSFDREMLLRRLAEEAAPGRLSGHFFSAKDLISNTDLEVAGGSRFLAGYNPPFNASVYVALKEEGAFNVVQANSDEFGMGGNGLCSAYGIVPNPLDPTRIIGGSSSGSVYLIRRGLTDFSLTSDTGDSARFPAALVGIVGFKPSYGAVSRHGFFPFCSSFDTPSICASDVDTVARVFSVVSFPDPHDLCTLGTVRRDYEAEAAKPLEGPLRIAVLEETFWSGRPIETPSHREVRERFGRLLERLRSERGDAVETVSLGDPRLLRLCGLIYNVVAFAESVSNYSNLTGLLFPIAREGEGVRILNRDRGGNYAEILTNNRSVFGDEFTYRQILGRYFVEGENYENMYLRCKRLLTLINGEIDRIFARYDLIISPTSFDVPDRIDDCRRGYSPRNDSNIRLLANFCALPAISIPWETVEGLPVGLHIMAAHSRDALLLRVAAAWSRWLEEDKWGER